MSVTNITVKYTLNEIGLAIDYWQDGDWRCLDLYRVHTLGEISNVLDTFLSRAKALGVAVVESSRNF